jgi:hypothetical protein
MKPVGTERFDVFLSRSGIRVADPAHRIGRELSYAKPSPRTIIIHFGESDGSAYLAAVVRIVLKTEGDYFLTPRYGRASDLGLMEGTGEFAAILFTEEDRPRLVEYLCTRPMEIGLVSIDLYVLSATGNLLLTWDHHAASEGLTVELCQVDQATQLLVSLNELGAELEVHYVDR